MPDIGFAGTPVPGGITTTGDRSAGRNDLSMANQADGIRCIGDLVSQQNMAWGGVRAELRKRERSGPDYVEVKIPQHAVFLVRRQTSVPVRWRADSDRPVTGNVTSNHIHFVAAGTHLRSEYPSGYPKADYLALFIEPMELASLTSDTFDPARTQFRSGWLNQDLTARRIMFALAEEIERPDQMSRLFAESATMLLMLQLVRHSSGSAPTGDRVAGGLPSFKLKRVIDYICDRLADELSLNELAAMVDLSPHHFCRVFKQSTGLPPHRWQIQQRIERSKTLMLETDLSLAQIAVAAGFSDQSHFTTVFRTNLGVTPNVWRRSTKT